MESGICIIINNMFGKDGEYTCTSDGKKLSYRAGSYKDKASLEELFKWLKFEVKPYDNVDKEIMKNILKEHAKEGSYDCFVCCILSHGYENGIYCNDGETMDFSEIRRFFTSENYWVGKPKLFIIQACQGTKMAKGLVADSPFDPSSSTNSRQPGLIASEADFSFFVAATPGTYIYYCEFPTNHYF